MTPDERARIVALGDQVEAALETYRRHAQTCEGCRACLRLLEAANAEVSRAQRVLDVIWTEEAP